MKRINLRFYAVLLAILLPQCKANYPRCDQDRDCAQRGEVCLNGQCQECREDAQCALRYPGQQRRCAEGRCEEAVQCHLDADCAAFGTNLICNAGACVQPCRSDTDCAGAATCRDHRCISRACDSDAACGANQLCRNNLCVLDRAAEKTAAKCRPALAGELVRLEPLFFDFDVFELNDAARIQLEEAVTCLRLAPASLHLVVEGHCDDRGTQEYNLALGERRAQAVVAYLKQLGIHGRQLTVRSKGENEPLCSEATETCYSRNRRVQFIQNPAAAL